MPARDALHLQVQMKTELDSPGALLADMLDTFERSQRGMPFPPGSPEAVANPVGLFAHPTRGGMPYKQGQLARIIHSALQVSLPFYVAPAMSPVVTAAAEMMPDEPLEPQDLPHTHGFLHLPQGLMTVDIRGRMLVHNAVLWAVRGGGVDIYWLSNKHDPRDSMNIIGREQLGERWADMPLLTLAMYTRVEFGGTVPLSRGAQKVLPPEIAAQVVVDQRADGTLAWMWPEGYDLTEWMNGAAELRPDSGTAWIVAMWRLMQQTLTDVSEETVDRPLRKYARRVNMQQNTVVVIKLRKKKGQEGDGTFEYSHRFWRRGHWRMAWVGSGPEKRQRAVYIHPTLVNADREDLPILVRDHIYSLSR